MLHRAYSDPGPLAADISVVIPRGASGQAIAATLVDVGVAADTRLFAIALRFLAPERPLRAGEYAFAARISLRDVVAKLQAGETVVRRMTVAEGLTTREVLELISMTEGLAGSLPEASELGEGVLLPETYHFSLGDARVDLVARMTTARDAALARLWGARKAGLPLATPKEALILASIVERETGVPEERGRVAGVFINRLTRGMRLQSDPTVAYGLANENGPLDRPLRRADLEVDHPYNTYVHRGLPPGPIANPGLASIAAVLNPAETDDLYFVADGTGGHAFARTLAEHNRNVARWRRIQREQRAR
ncbi:MAG: endolytic transglycosylase MltG [Rhodospirillaceae bacterium]|nr:endolytic transglycosylase MltG [Rhodospirillaceae bacterium]MBT4773858.1 endolytic transglycosylase MltG [Rhodospirillaceae bacterium]MBT5357425.1 endolytic transglycosylase MltG [Rhodospirillaceae bacterium]MBT5770436.1 endolytic transglycosylase MltG [Rhodospirillaceae bacterium]MBT6310440.1 endolytic transglycosylase MltG [Rhodospirillaceae bacterium]